jgi:hypothetical protein
VSGIRGILRSQGEEVLEVALITELRRDRIRADKIASWVEFFGEAARRNEAGGSQVEFAGVDPETGTFIWLRTPEIGVLRR